jgi:hypothetical protein
MDSQYGFPATLKKLIDDVCLRLFGAGEQEQVSSSSDAEDRTAGGSCMRIRREINGKSVLIKYTEFPTLPTRAFVVTETAEDGIEKATWLQDANGKLFQLEYEGSDLIQYRDLSAKPSVTWTAVRDNYGDITNWSGVSKAGEVVSESMSPRLESVDHEGNRFFRNESGTKFIVRPSGAAFYPRATVNNFAGYLNTSIETPALR